MTFFVNRCQWYIKSKIKSEDKKRTQYQNGHGMEAIYLFTHIYTCYIFTFIQIVFYSTLYHFKPIYCILLSYKGMRIKFTIHTIAFDDQMY